MELRRYWAVIRRYACIIMLTTVAGGVLALYVTLTSHPIYRAETTLEIDPSARSLSDPSSAQSYGYYHDPRLVEQAAQAFATKVKTPRFLQKVRDRLGLEDIDGSIEIRHVEGTPFVRLTAESADPALAQAIANTGSQVLIDQEVSRQQARIREGLEQLEGEITALEESVADAREGLALLAPTSDTASALERQERARLESALTRDETRLVVLLNSAEDLRRALFVRTEHLSIFAPAEVPEEPKGPGMAQLTALGGVSGLVIGVSIAFLLEYLDDTLRSPDDVKRVLSLGVLGTLPQLKPTMEGMPLVATEDALGPASEAFRDLRTSVHVANVDKRCQMLLVTSPLSSDGKTFTAANLAAVVAQGEQRVILVDADMRHPVQHRLFDVCQAPGLAYAMLGDERSWDGIMPNQPFAGAGCGHDFLRDTRVDGLQLVTCGEPPSNPAELLASHRFGVFVNWLREQTDMVIFDSPPVLSVTDALLLANQLDGVILVIDSGRTRRPAAARAVERLTGVGADILGVVLNRLSPRADGYTYVYYSYGDAHARDGRSKDGRWRGWLAPPLAWGRARGKRDHEADGGT